MMKKFLLGIAMVLASGSSFAEDYLTMMQSSVDLQAGDSTEVTFRIVCDQANTYAQLQMDILLPAGIEPSVCNWDDAKSQYEAALAAGQAAYEEEVEFAIEDGIDPSTIKLEDFIGNIHLENYLDSISCVLSNSSDFILASSYLKYDDPTCETPGYSRLRVLLITISTATFPSPRRAQIFKLGLKATDKAYTDGAKILIDNIQLAAPSGVGVEFADVEGTQINYQIKYDIKDSKYGTFCWPVALDFTGKDVTASVATETKNGFVTREPITMVPANTPIILSGEAGTYQFTTTKDKVDAVSKNILVGTAEGPVTVGASDKFFALAKHDKGVGFYRCDEGVVIPQYRAYIKSAAAAADAFLFEETTGINNVEATAENADVYTISGVKVEKAAQKGIYIVNGKKVVVK